MGKIINNWENQLSLLVPYINQCNLTPEFRNIWNTARHSNGCYELHIILEGTCNLCFDTVTYSMKAGQAVIIAPNVIHVPSNVSSPFKHFAIPFFVSRELLNAVSIVNEKGYLFFELERNITDLCQEIFEQIDSEMYLYREYISALFSQLMILCFRAIHVPSNCKQKDAAYQIQDDEIDHMDKFFATYPLERQTCEEMAAYLHCSRRQVNRKMQAIYGITFQQKLIISRMDKARYLLRNTELSVNEISSRVGYADNAAFYRIFRQHIGITPTQYRKEK